MFSLHYIHSHVLPALYPAVPDILWLSQSAVLAEVSPNTTTGHAYT
jgi:hypothetical protein